jgi:uncharacterized protein involved in response to NO
MAGEPPVYRPFALLAFGATVLVATPLGVWLLAGLQLGVAALPVDWLLFHGGVQVFGFFGVLIVGVAHHLLPRFTGRPVAASELTPWLLRLLAAGLALRAAALVSGAAALAVAGALAYGAAFALFTGWVWRALDPPPLARLRRHLTASSLWLAAACLLEVAVRTAALAAERPIADLGAMRAVHSIALLGGVIGWVTGVLLRAGPMFVANWRVPRVVAALVPWGPGLAVALSAAAAVPAGPVAAVALARLGDVAALGTVAAVAVSAGALRRPDRAPPMLSRSREEARIFRLGMISALVAGLGAAALALGAAAALPHHVLADAVRHLVTVGFLTSVVVAMTFRLIPVLEGVALPWPGLRHVALGALLASVLLRTAQGVTVYGWSGLRPAVVLSGPLAWIALAAVAVNLVAAVASRRA